MNELFYVYFFTFFHVIVFHIFQKWLKDVERLKTITESKGHQISNSQLPLMVSKDLTWKFSIET